MPYEFNSLDEACDAFLEKCQAESKTQFEQSDIAAEACSEKHRMVFGATEEEILLAIGRKAKRSETTMWSRLLVGRMFPADLVHDLFPDGVRNHGAPDIYWSHYETCARTWTEETPDAPYQWLRIAIDEGLSVRRLRAKIAKHDGDPEDTCVDTYVLDNTPVVVTEWTSRGFSVEFMQPFEPIVLEGGEVVWPGAGDQYLLTALKQPIIVRVPDDRR